MRAIPSAVHKVRRAPRRHRPFVALREAVRLAGRYKYGPVWAAAEGLTRSLGRLFHRRRRRRRK